MIVSPILLFILLGLAGATNHHLHHQLKTLQHSILVPVNSSIKMSLNLINICDQPNYRGNMKDLNKFTHSKNTTCYNDSKWVSINLIGDKAVLMPHQPCFALKHNLGPLMFVCLDYHHRPHHSKNDFKINFVKNRLLFSCNNSSCPIASINQSYVDSLPKPPQEKRFKYSLNENDFKIISMIDNCPPCSTWKESLPFMAFGMLASMIIFLVSFLLYHQVKRRYCNQPSFLQLRTSSTEMQELCSTQNSSL